MEMVVLSETMSAMSEANVIDFSDFARTHQTFHLANWLIRKYLDDSLYILRMNEEDGNIKNKPILPLCLK